MRKIFSYIMSCIAVSIIGCSDRMDEIKKIDTEPTISFVHNGENKSNITDSVRYYISSPFYYNLKLAINDEKKNIWKLNYNVQKGDATVYYDGKELSGNSLRVDIKEILLAVKPSSKGLINVDFTIQDRYENTNTAKLNLFVFDNLIPVAKLSTRKIAVNAALEYTIDGSESYDQDHNFGGTVVGYVYQIDGKNIETTNKQINYIFPTPGTYLIKLQVIDNSGAPSKITELKVNVN